MAISHYQKLTLEADYRTTNQNFTITVNDTTVLSAWETMANQDFRIKAAYMDNKGSSDVDEIIWTDVWAIINGQEWVKVGNHTTGDFDWNTSEVTAQTGINLRVRAIDVDGTNTYSANFTKNSDMEIAHEPDAPTNLVATAINGTQIDLAWTAPAEDNGRAVTSYAIQRESPVGDGFVTIVTSTGSAGATFSDSPENAAAFLYPPLNDATKYNYRVNATNSIGTGDASNEDSAITDFEAAETLSLGDTISIDRTVSLTESLSLDDDYCHQP